MKVGVIGSGSIGPDLAYGFLSSVAPRGGSVVLHDIKQEALDAGMARVQGYIGKGLKRGKISAKAADKLKAGLSASLELKDLAGCDYVLEAASENLEIKQAILAQLEGVVGADCLIGFATSGIPRAQIAAKAKHPDRCFVNHPFFPAWRALPIELVLSEDAALSERMTDTLKQLGKAPIITADVACFAADDIFVNYCAEAARIVAEGLATPSQVDKVVDAAIGGGGPFWVMDLTKGNLLNVHCMELMKAAPTGNDWFTPPPIFTKQGNTPWHPGGKPGREDCAPEVAKQIRDRVLAVLLGRTYFVADNKICEPGALNWLTRMALGYRTGLLDFAEELGADEVKDLCTRYAKDHPGFEVPVSIAEGKLASFYRTLSVERDGDIAVVKVQRPEVKNALSDQTMAEIAAVMKELDGDASVKGIVLSSFDGALAGADITELAVLPDPKSCEENCLRGYKVLEVIAGLGKPVVAAVDGPVMGGGAELSMACHARVVGKKLMLGQPEVNLGIIPGYGGTQRLPRLVGVERAIEMLRVGSPVGAKQACEWGWAQGEPVDDVLVAAKNLIHKALAGDAKLGPVDPKPLEVPAKLPAIDLGHHSLTIDEILVDVIRRGWVKPLAEGLKVEAEGFGRCKATVDMDIGMKNFMQNGPRVPASFLHE